MYEAQLREAIVTIRRLRAELESSRHTAPEAEPIAVIGIGCRFPGGADSPEHFVDMLERGQDAVRETPVERWDNARWYDPDPDVPGRIATRWGAFLDGLDAFDCERFGLSEREVAEMDPQHRLLLETAWEGLERAAIAPCSLRGARCGVFVGLNGDEYYQQGIADPVAITAHTLSGGVASAAAGRIAFLLGVHGPALAIDTACSSSLSAVHLACRSLRARETDLALAGGAYVVLEPNLSVGLSRLRMLAADGRCKPFDARADGFVQGEGAGMVVLKRLSDALAARDPIVALIRGTAINQDGRSVGLTAPSRQAQTAVIREALADAGVEPDAVGFVECHGTGTALGDPIECHALADVFGEHGGRPLWLGALKSNIGHLGPAAGIAGLIKTALVLQSGRVPPNLHFQQLNPQIDSAPLQFAFPQAVHAFPAPGERRIAGVSSFGFAGSNAHAVLEAFAPPIESPAASEPRPSVVLLLSARSPEALREQCQDIEAVLAAGTELAAVARSLARGRDPGAYRAAIVACDAASASAALRAVEPVLAGSRPRLALAGGDSQLEALLTKIGVSPYVRVVPGPVPEGEATSVPQIEWPGDSAAIAARLRELGIGLVVDTGAVDAGRLAADLGLRRHRHEPLAEDAALRLCAALFEAGFLPAAAAVAPPGPHVALPVTRLRRNRCWREPRPRAATSPALPGERIDVPQPGWHFRLALELERYPWLADHAVGGAVLVPGAFQIACLLAAARDAGVGEIELHSISFAQSLVVSAGERIGLWTSLVPLAPGRYAMSLSQRRPDGMILRHCEAEALAGRDRSEPEDWTPAVAGDQGERLDGDAWQRELTGLGIEIGPAFRALRELIRGDGWARARVEAVAGRSMLDGGPHPALLDACLQAAGGALPSAFRGRTLLPIGIDRVRCSAQLPAVLDVRVRARGAGDEASFDLRAVDGQGITQLEVDGLAVRAVEPARVGSIELEAYAETSVTVAMAPPSPGRRRLLLVEEASDLGQLARQVSGDALTRVEPLLPADAAAVRPTDIDELVLCQRGAQPELAWHWARVVAGLDAPPRFTVACLGTAAPLAWAGAGLAASLALEQPLARPRFIVAEDIGALLPELAGADAEDRVQCAGGQRSVTRLARAPLRAARAPSLSGSVLVTGAFGGLGRALVPWLLERGAERLVLVGRRPDTAFAARQATASGRNVECVAADIGRQDGVDAVLAALGDSRLSALYHLAGAQAPGPLATQDAERFAAAFNAKARGALWLDAALADHPIREFVLISSLAALMGAAGLGSYGAANAVLDALAEDRRRRGLPGCSVRLGWLSDAGMAADLNPATLSRLEAEGIRPMTVDEALQALGAALAEGRIDPVLARIDWSVQAKRRAGGLPPRLASALESPPDENPKPDAPASIETQVLAELRVVAGMPAERRVDRSCTLVQLGFDSLMAIDLRNRLRRRFGQAPSVGRLLGDARIDEWLADLEPSPARDDWEELIL